MGHVEVAHVSHALPDGRLLLDDASFRVGEGVTAALVGPNGAGKTTLLRLISGDLQVQMGTIGRSGGIGVMRQFIGGCQGGGSQGEQSAGNIGAGSTVRNLLISTAPPRVQAASQLLDAAELAMMDTDDESAAMAYASALTDWRCGRLPGGGAVGRLLRRRARRAVRTLPRARGGDAVGRRAEAPGA